MPRRIRTRTRVLPFEEVIVDQAPKRWTRELQDEECIALPAAADVQDRRTIGWVIAGLLMLAISHGQPAAVPAGIVAAQLSSFPAGGGRPASVYWPEKAPGLY